MNTHHLIQDCRIRILWVNGRSMKGSPKQCSSPLDVTSKLFKIHTNTVVPSVIRCRNFFSVQRKKNHTLKIYVPVSMRTIGLYMHDNFINIARMYSQCFNVTFQSTINNSEYYTLKILEHMRNGRSKLMGLNILRTEKLH